MLGKLGRSVFVCVVLLMCVHTSWISYTRLLAQMDASGRKCVQSFFIVLTQKAALFSLSNIFTSANTTYVALIFPVRIHRMPRCRFSTFAFFRITSSTQNACYIIYCSLSKPPPTHGAHTPKMLARVVISCDGQRQEKEIINDQSSMWEKVLN